MTFTHALATNNYGCAKFIVDASAANGTHTTIASALTSATSGDTIFLRPGTYTENLTLKAGVNLAAYVGDCQTPTVTISGKLTATFAGTCTVSGIRLQTNSDFLLSVTGSSATIVFLFNCFLNITNNTGIQFTSSSASSQITLQSCNGNVTTTGIAIFAHSAAGLFEMQRCLFNNSGGSTTQNTCSSGALSLNNGVITTPVTTSSTANFGMANFGITTEGQNVTAITQGSTGGNWFNCTISGGTASAVSIGGAVNMAACIIRSTNTNAITGAGSLIYTGLWMAETSSLVNTTTKTGRNILVGGISFDAGVNILDTYTVGTFTPTLTGLSTAGVTTYSAQNGYFVRIGAFVFATAVVVGSAATGTGNSQLGGLPFTIKNATNYDPIGSLTTFASLTWPASTTSIATQAQLNSTVSWVRCCGTGTTNGYLQLANVAFNYQYSLNYQV